MNETYELVLGLEIHIQLKTASKMFCGCSNKPFAETPNTHVCPICLGLPGAMPSVNQEAIKLAQKLAFALGSTLNRQIIFERKNYFYPDLPKGFQITCPHYPISKGGSFALDLPKNSNDSSIGLKSSLNINFREIHLEEDTAKSEHKEGKTFLDFNKSGVPLLEIVTEPDFRKIEDAVTFCKEIQLICRKLKISDADMEKGQMRLEANISVRKKGENALPNYRVELKNINSFTFMKKALTYELRRQQEALDNGEKLIQETRGFDENLQKTFSQRDKEEAHDYRYFPEPDIPPIIIDDAWYSEITTSTGLSHLKLRSELIEAGLNKHMLNVLEKDEEVYQKYLGLVSLAYSPVVAASLVTNVQQYKDKTYVQIDEIEKQKKNSLISDDSEVTRIIEQIINQNPNAIEDYKKGKQGSLEFLLGCAMKITKGKIDPNLARKTLLTLLGGVA